VFKDLGLLYYFNGERQKAAYCLARYLDDIPTDNEAKNILQLVMRISHDISS
jgi:regulator of sirC expression with transglutaminase-like and TPR domain